MIGGKVDYAGSGAKGCAEFGDDGFLAMAVLVGGEADGDGFGDGGFVVFHGDKTSKWIGGCGGKRGLFVTGAKKWL
jgi:hypothetical protein